MRSAVQRGLIGSALLALCLLAGALPARAQQLQNLYPNFFSIADPAVLDAFMFGGAFGSPKYGVVDEGFQAEQSVTPYIGIVSRLTGYQVWVGDHYDNPLVPATGHQSRLNFGRAQGGLEFEIYPGTHLFVLGGHDFGDSDATVIEGDVSSWWFTHTPHPVNLSFSALHNYQNHVTSAEIDPRIVATSTDDYLVTAGVGGAIYQGGTIGAAQGQGGVDLGIYFRKWAIGLDMQAGYGTADGYGEVSFIKQWDFFE